LFVSSEVAPFSKTGGLGDVSGALPTALAARGVELLTVTPLWPTVPKEGLSDRGSITLQFPFGTVSCRVLTRDRFAFLAQPQLFERSAIYGESDDARRFAVFSMGALSAAQALGFRPDVVHANDWPTGLCALALSRGYSTTSLKRAKCVFTIHNLAYAGTFPKHTMNDLGLPWELFHPNAVEFFDQLSFLKAGLVYADALTTVSATYAKEIQTVSGGQGLHGLLQKRAGVLTGILNGIDVDAWNPGTDAHLSCHFTGETLDGKEACSRALLDRFRLKSPDRRTVRPPLFGTVGRLVDQKGVELLIAALPSLLQRGAQAVVVGTGEPRYEAALTALAQKHKGALAVHVGFDEALAHQVEAGADFFVMPSQFEPCGLNQMYSLRYGTVPVVRAVGGLEDTVVDLSRPDGTGIKFHDYSPLALLGALERALELYQRPSELAQVRRRGMAQDFSWDRAAARYEALYTSLL
jgi:starch synthase